MFESIGRGASAAPASGGLVLLDRQLFSSSGTWVKPADGSGNLLPGVNKLVIVRQQGGGGGGYSDSENNGGAGGTTSFGPYASATGGAGGRGGVSSDYASGGMGSLRAGRAGSLMTYENVRWQRALGGGDGARSGENSVRGGGGWARFNFTNSFTGSGGGEGGESYDVFKIGDLTNSVTVTIGAAGAAGAATNDNAGGPGWMVVEVWGVLS